MTGVAALLHWLAIPEVGLGAVFVIAFVSATLLPMGSEPAVFGLVKLQPELFWPAILVATVGNTLGGALTWWMGAAAHRAAERVRHHGEAAPELRPGHDKAADHRALRWLQRYGAQPACWHGCRWWGTRCVRWPAGCACRSGLACSTWPSANWRAT